MSDFCERRQHRAKKPHVCELCNRPILPGCEYILVKTNRAGQHGMSSNTTAPHGD